MAAMYGFSDQCTAVGTSYFVRLAARDERCGTSSSSLAPLSSHIGLCSMGRLGGGSSSQGLCLPYIRPLPYHMDVYHAAVQKCRL